MNGCKWLVAAAGVAMACAPARGQWVTQEIRLREGWNAVCVGVEPAKGSLEAVGGGEGVEGVWRWDKRFTSAEYVADEGSPLAKDPHWKAWYPGEEIGFLSTLGEMSGWRCYLMKIKEGSGERVARIKGKAKLPRVEWHPNALNLAGFPVGEGGATFEGWLRLAILCGRQSGPNPRHRRRLDAGSAPRPVAGRPRKSHRRARPRRPRPPGERSGRTPGPVRGMTEGPKGRARGRRDSEARNAA